LDAQGVDLAAFKEADDGRGIIVRLIEMHGRHAHVGLRLGWRAQQMIPCDLRERPLEKGKGILDYRVDLELGPYEIGTYRFV